MGIQETCWGVFLAGLPFAHAVIFPSNLSIWRAQTFWAQGWIVALFGMTLIYSTKSPMISNRPLGWWIVWTGLSVVWTWMTYLRNYQEHPLGLLAPSFHYLCVVFFFMAATRQWTAGMLQRLLRWIAWSGVILVGYGLLQYVGFDQFYRSMDVSATSDVLMGTLGNPTHFGTHLALLLPVFLWQPSRWWLFIAMLSTGLIVLTRSTSAVVCGYLVWIGWSLLEQKPWWMVGGLGVGGTLLIGWLIRSDSSWVNPEGRLSMWSYLWQRYLDGEGKQQILGAGLGRIFNDATRNLPGWPAGWRHAHCEYLQVLIEQGVVGFGVVLWGIWDAVNRWRHLPRTGLSNALAGIGGVFLLAGAVNFPAHLWVLGSLGLVAYCGMYVLSVEPNTV